MSPSSSKSALLVDVGGVLLLLNRTELAPVIADFGGVRTPDDFYRAHCAAHNAAHPAHGEPRDYYEILPEYAGVPEDRRSDCRRAFRAACATQNMWHAPDPRSKSALADFTADGVRVAIVSQADGRIADMLLTARMCQQGPGPGVEVDRVFDSAVVGLNKPDPRFFLHATTALGVTPDQAVHVGDTVPADVVGARNAGILPVHYDPFDDCDDPGDHDHVHELAEMSRYLISDRSSPAPR